jgi:hypothetical protein
MSGAIRIIGDSDNQHSIVLKKIIIETICDSSIKSTIEDWNLDLFLLKALVTIQLLLNIGLTVK